MNIIHTHQDVCFLDCVDDSRTRGRWPSPAMVVRSPRGHRRDWGTCCATGSYSSPCYVCSLQAYHDYRIWRTKMSKHKHISNSMHNYLSYGPCHRCTPFWQCRFWVYCQNPSSGYILACNDVWWAWCTSCNGEMLWKDTLYWLRLPYSVNLSVIMCTA